MRKIKFKRAHFEDESKTVFVRFSEWGVNIGHAAFVSPASVGHAYYFIDYQFVGFQDKNGKDIYEGNIIKGRKGNNYKIVYEKGSFVLYHTKLKDWDGSDLKWGLLSRLFDNDIKKLLKGIEIIGNIHDNPELVESI